MRRFLLCRRWSSKGKRGIASKVSPYKLKKEVKFRIEMKKLIIIPWLLDKLTSILNSETIIIQLLLFKYYCQPTSIFEKYIYFRSNNLITTELILEKLAITDRYIPFNFCGLSQVYWHLRVPAINSEESGRAVHGTHWCGANLLPEHYHGPRTYELFAILWSMPLK